MSETKYRHVARVVFETPWAIVPHVLSTIVELVHIRLDGGRLTDDEIAARIEEPQAARAGRNYSSKGAVAVIPLTGVLVPRANLFTEISGGTSLQRFQDAVKAAVADETVGTIVLDVDSPGGSVSQVPETAALIRAAREHKRVIAVANGMAASAAYWIGSQASEFVVTPSGLVGSIGVLSAHDDRSGMQEMQGVKTTLISAGKFKTEGNPYEPLTEEAAAAIKSLVDEYYGMFVADVAKGRGVAQKTVRGGYGEGRVLTSANALEAGMVDRVATLEAVLSKAIGGKRSGAAAELLTPADVRASEGLPELEELDDQTEETAGEQPDGKTRRRRLADVRGQGARTRASRTTAALRPQL